MIDLNYLYTYSTYKAKDRAPNAVEYLTANAFVKQSKQDFSKYFDGIFAERVEYCVTQYIAHQEVELNAIDVFALALEGLGYSLSDFVTACKNAPITYPNALDAYFYTLTPDNRIFAGFNELRERGNTAYFNNIRRPNEIKPYREICTPEHLFSAPIKNGFCGTIVDSLNALNDIKQPKNSEPRNVSGKDLQALIAIFYLVKNDGKLVLDIPENSAITFEEKPEKLMKRIYKLMDEISDEINVNNIEQKEIRDCIYIDLYEDYAVGKFWKHSENYLNGLDVIKSSGKEKYTKAKNGITRPVFEIYNSKKVNKIANKNQTANRKSEADWEDVADFSITVQQCQDFRNKIVGQKSAVQTVIDKLAGVSCGFYSNNRPIASFLMSGPTGVGKTETAKAMADVFFGGRLLTVDMSTFKHPGDISRLIGSAPGYVGYDDKVALLEFLDKSPNGVINFDEIDKCDRSCLSFLLSLLDEGKFSSAKGGEYSVKNFVITCTTNQSANISSRSDNNRLDEMMSRTGESGSPFVKEFLGRFDNLLEYRNLSKDDLREILSKKLDSKISTFNNNKPDNSINLKYNERLLDDILIDAHYKTTGARALNGSVQKMFVRPISYYLVQNGNNTQEREIVVAGDNTLLVNGEKVQLPESFASKKFAEPEQKQQHPTQSMYS